MENRSAWLEERRRGIGGSDAAAVCGMSPWKTPLDVYFDKIGEGRDEETPDMRRGSILEPAVTQMYADATGFSVRKPDSIARNPAYPWAIANVDGLAGTEGAIVLECKTARNRYGWGDPWSDQIPTAYLFQVQHYLAVMERNVAHVAVLFGTDFEFSVYEVAADDEFRQLMMEREAEFWRWVESRTPPDPITPSDISKRWPISKPIGRKATKSDLEIGGHLLAVRDYFKKLEMVKESLEAELKRSMEDVEALTCGEETICTWKTAKGASRFDTKRFQAEHPELYEQYLYQSAPSRRFLFKEKCECLQIMKPLLQENLLPQRNLLGS